MAGKALDSPSIDSADLPCVRAAAGHPKMNSRRSDTFFLHNMWVTAAASAGLCRGHPDIRCINWGVHLVCVDALGFDTVAADLENRWAAAAAAAASAAAGGCLPRAPLPWLRRCTSWSPIGAPWRCACLRPRIHACGLWEADDSNRPEVRERESRLPVDTICRAAIAFIFTRLRQVWTEQLREWRATIYSTICFTTSICVQTTGWKRTAVCDSVSHFQALRLSGLCRPQVWTERFREWCAAHMLQPLVQLLDGAHQGVRLLLLAR